MHILYLQEDFRMHLISNNCLQEGGLMIILTTSRYDNDFSKQRFVTFSWSRGVQIYFFLFYDITYEEILQAFLLWIMFY